MGLWGCAKSSFTGSFRVVYEALSRFYKVLYGIFRETTYSTQNSVV